MLVLKNVEPMVDGGDMYVPYLGERVKLSSAFLSFSDADDAAVCILNLDRKVAPQLTPTVIKDSFLVRVPPP